MNNLSISGGASMNGGEFGKVSISGSGRISGDVKCENMSVSGSCKVTGNVVCSEEIKVSGSASINGDIACAGLKVSGSASAKAVKAGEMRVSGSFNAAGSIQAKNLNASGSVASDGDIVADKIVIRGGIKTDHLVSADEVDIKFSANCKAGEIGGGVIKVCPGKENVGLLGRLLFQRGKISAHIGTIEGDDIYLEACTVGAVRGTKVVIGPNCEIDKVEYSGTLEVDDSAKVGESVKV